MTDPLGQSQVLPYLIGLADEYDIHILSSEKPKRFKQLKATISEICNEHRITWHPVKYNKKPPVFSGIYDYIQLYKTAKNLHKKLGFSIAHCRSYIPGIVGLRLQKKFNIPFIFDMRGFWADERKESGSWNVNNPVFNSVYRYFKYYEKRFFSEADAVISLTEAGKSHIESLDLQSRSPITVIPCCADFSLFNYQDYSSGETNELKKSLGFSETDFVLTYLGSIGGSYLIDEMMIFFKALKEIKPESKFLIITKTSSPLIAESMTKHGVSENDVVITPSERNTLPKLLTVSDASVFFYRPTFSRTGTSPTKFPELMGVGIPVIGNKKVGDIERIITQTNTGIVIDVTNLDELKSGAQDLIDFSTQADKMKIRKSGIQCFNLDDGIERYRTVYKTVQN